MGWRSISAVTVLVAAGACGGGKAGGVAPDEWPVPDRRAACYELRYAAEGGARLPRMLVLDRGGRSGRAFWFPASRADTAWRAYYARGRWSRPGRGRVEVIFADGDEAVRLDLRQQNAYSIGGEATRPGVERAVPVEGSHVSCPRPPAPPREGTSP